MKCPKCKKDTARKVKYRGTTALVCDCGYDERDILDTMPDQKTNQKAKANFSPYRAGGKKGTRK